MKIILSLVILVFPGFVLAAGYGLPDLVIQYNFWEKSLMTAISAIGASAVMVSIVIAGYKHLKRLF